MQGHIIAAGVLAALLPSTSIASAPADPGPKPALEELQAGIQTQLHNSMLDPDSVKIDWADGGSAPEIKLSAKYGWVLCASMNAYGAYTGYQEVLIHSTISKVSGRKLWWYDLGHEQECAKPSIEQPAAVASN